MELKLNLPSGFIEAINQVCKQYDLTPAEFMQTKIVDCVARESAFADVFGKQPIFAIIPFMKDQDGDLVTGDSLFMFLKDLYLKQYAANIKPDEVPAWN